MKILLVSPSKGDNGARQWSVCHKGDSPLREGSPLFLPEFSPRISASMVFAIRTNRVGKFISKRFASRYYDKFTFAIDFAAQDILEQAKKEGLPWGLATSFDGSAAFGQWQDIYNCKNAYCRLNGEIVAQLSNIDGAYFDIIDEAIEMLSRYYTIKIGDLIMLSFGGIDIENISIDDNIQIDIDKNTILSVNIK